MTARPLLRRVAAALVLYGFAIVSVFFWNDWRVDWTTMTINLVAATTGLAFLHVRWRQKERSALSPTRLKDIFS
jgi:hypothetical protein